MSPVEKAALLALCRWQCAQLSTPFASGISPAYFAPTFNTSTSTSAAILGAPSQSGCGVCRQLLGWPDVRRMSAAHIGTLVLLRDVVVHSR
jgi:hypothetical protein